MAKSGRPSIVSGDGRGVALVVECSGLTADKTVQARADSRCSSRARFAEIESVGGAIAISRNCCEMLPRKALASRVKGLGSRRSIGVSEMGRAQVDTATELQNSE